MRTDRAVSNRIAMRPIVDRQTPVKTLPSLAVGKYVSHLLVHIAACLVTHLHTWILTPASLYKVDQITNGCKFFYGLECLHMSTFSKS